MLEDIVKRLLNLYFNICTCSCAECYSAPKVAQYLHSELVLISQYALRTL